MNGAGPFLPAAMRLPPTHQDMLPLISKNWRWQIRLTPMGKKALHFDLDIVQLGHVQLIRGSYDAPYLMEGAIPKDSVMIALPYGGGKTVVRNAPLQGDALVLFTDHREFDLVTQMGNGNHTIVVSRPFFENLFTRHFGVDPTRRFDASLLRLKGGAEEYIRWQKGWLASLQSALLAGGTGMEASLVRQIEETLLCELFAMLECDEAPDIEAAESKKLARARAFLHDHMEENFSMTFLARELQMSVRSLQNLFQKHLGITPKHYLKQIRLQAIHEALKRGDKETVREIAEAYGFYHMGYFGTEYKKFYGQPPSQTLRHR
ncbi:helix-turn-helix domain-containing protein [Hydrogenimonas sp.]